MSLTFAVCTPWHIQSVVGVKLIFFFFLLVNRLHVVLMMDIMTPRSSSLSLSLLFLLFRCRSASMSLWNEIWINFKCYFLTKLYGIARMCAQFSLFLNVCACDCACACDKMSTKIMTKVEFRLFKIYVIRLAPVWHRMPCVCVLVVVFTHTSRSLLQRN